LIKNILASFFGRINLYKKFVRFLVQKLEFHDVQDIFQKEKPVAIFAPSLIDNDFDVPFVVEARRYGIDVFGMVRSWDNLNNHGLLAFVPDLLILQNEWLKEAGYKFQDFSNKRPRIEFAGLPHYDKYFNFKNRIKPRDLFFKELGLDPSKKLILLGGSDFYYTENKLPQIIDNLIEENKIDEPVQVLFRPHPSGLFNIGEYNLDGLKNIILNDAFSNSKIKFTDDDVLINIFYYSDIIMNIASTLSIDAAVFDKPVICIGFDAVSQKYWLSVERLYDSFDHYEKLLSTGGVCLVKNIEELARNINLYLEHPEKDCEGRVEIVKIFTGGKTGDSSKKLADIVSSNI
jgi:CDP-glycerol glycerophosphotransferase (TagB/SpsB family)